MVKSQNRNKDSRDMLLQTQIVGIYYTGNGDYISELPLKTELQLTPEPENRYDNHAVSVWHTGHKLGYIPRQRNRQLFEILSTGSQEISCLLGKFVPSHYTHSNNIYKPPTRYNAQRADITIFNYQSKIEWRPGILVPEDAMAF